METAVGTSDGFRIVNVDDSNAGAFLDYAGAYGAAHDDSFVSPEELTGFDPAIEPAVLALDSAGTTVGAASAMLHGYMDENMSRMRILQASDPGLYPPMLSALLPRVPNNVERVFLFLPEYPGAIADELTAAGFAESRRAYVMLHTSPGNVVPTELPGETTLTPARITSANDWANVVNTAFRGQPGRYDMTPERAAELLARERVIPEATLLAFRGGTPSGVVLTVADSESPYACEIETLGVMPADQHVGLGRALLREALRAAGRAGRSSVNLSVSTFNKRALALYLNAGFGVSDVRVCWEMKRAAS